jgi:phosphatidylserine/phosphatidylglycerophosphate/cardiolipin synthase-like enzyme
MKKLMHLIILVVFIGVSFVDANSNNRSNIKLQIGSRYYTDENGEIKSLTVSPRSVKISENGNIKYLPLIPIKDLQDFFDIDEIRIDNDSRKVTIYKEQPKLICNNIDKHGVTVSENLIKLIDNSKQIIRIEMYRLEDTSIVKELANVKKNNDKLEVRIILDKYGGNCLIGEGQNTISTENFLQEAGCQVRWKHCDKIMHRKVAVFDKDTFYLGSGNWTDQGLGTDEHKGKNWEMNIIWKNEEFSQQIIEDFDSKWDDPECVQEDYCD